VLGQSRDARIKIPKEGAFSLIKSKKERGMKCSCGLGKRKEGSRLISSRPGTNLHVARADSPRRPRGWSARCADGPTPRRGRSVICFRTPSVAPLPHEPRERFVSPDDPPGATGQSNPLPRTVRPSFTFSA
jgi:hypothetical protein